MEVEKVMHIRPLDEYHPACEAKLASIYTARKWIDEAFQDVKNKDDQFAILNAIRFVFGLPRFDPLRPEASYQAMRDYLSESSYRDQVP